MLKRGSFFDLVIAGIIFLIICSLVGLFVHALVGIVGFGVAAIILLLWAILSREPQRS